MLPSLSHGDMLRVGEVNDLSCSELLLGSLNVSRSCGRGNVKGADVLSGDRRDNARV